MKSTVLLSHISDAHALPHFLAAKSYRENQLFAVHPDSTEPSITSFTHVVQERKLYKQTTIIPPVWVGLKNLFILPLSLQSTLLHYHHRNLAEQLPHHIPALYPRWSAVF